MFQGKHSAILSTFNKLPFVIKTFVLSIFKWPFYTGFTVCKNLLSFRPFSTDQRINTIDPRSYFYLFDFIEQSRMARRDLALVTTWVSKRAYSLWKLAHIWSVIIRNSINICFGGQFWNPSYLSNGQFWNASYVCPMAIFGTQAICPLWDRTYT